MLRRGGAPGIWRVEGGDAGCAVGVWGLVGVALFVLFVDVVVGGRWVIVVY